MKAITLLAIFLGFTKSIFGQQEDKFLKDLDFDTIIDTTYIDYKNATIVCKLSSKNFKKIESQPIEILNLQSGIVEAQNGFKFENHWMRSGYSNQFRYDKASQKIQLIGMSRYEFGDVVNDGSGASSVNLLTDDYIGNWNYYDDEKDELKKIPSIQTKMYFSKTFLENFNENTYFDFAKKCTELYHRFKEIEINSQQYRGLIYDDTKTIKYTEFKPKKLDNIQIDNFYIENANQIDSFKIISGYYEPNDGQIIAPDTETDWGDRLLLLGNENEILYKSQGVGDVYLFEPHFYKSEKSDTILIIYQLAFEYYFGGEAFILKNGKIKYIGNLDIEGDNAEKSLIDIIEINEDQDRILFSFKSDLLVLEPGSEDILIKNNEVKYIYEDDKLVLTKR